MEDIGFIRAQYQVFKSSGIFSRGNKILQVCDHGIAFINPNYSKSKDRETFPFSEDFELEPTPKDISVKTKKQTFSLHTNQREKLLTSLYYYKDLYDASYNIQSVYKSGSFEGLRQLIPTDASTKIPVNLQIFRSALHISYDKNAYMLLHPSDTKVEMKRSPRHYAIFYNDITSVDILPNGFIFNTTVGTEQLIFDENSKDEIIQLLKELPFKYIGKNLELQDEPNLSKSLITGEDRFEISYETNMAGGLKRKVKAHFSKCILVEDEETNVLIWQIDLERVKWGSVKLKFNKPSTLTLGLPQGKLVKYKLNKEALGRFLCNTLQANEYPLLLNINIPGMKVLCDPDVDIDSGFEASLIKEIEEGLTELPKVFSSILLNALLSGTVNISFKSTGYDQRLISVLTEALKRLSAFIEKAETNVETLKDYIEFTDLVHKIRLSKDSTGNYIIDVIEPTLYNAYIRIAPLMCILRNILSKRDVAPDFTLYSDLTKTLLTISKSVNMLKAEKRLEVNKQWIVQELDLINVLSNTIIHLLNRPIAVLELYGLACVLTEVLPDKKEGLLAEDIKYVIATMLAQSHVLDMIESLITINSRPLKYEASQIQLKPLTLCFNAADIELFHAYQLEMLRFTVLLLIHLENFFGSTSERLRSISSQCISLGVAESVEGCKLMRRIFPKELFGKYNNPLKWDLEEWKRFLERTKNGFNGPTQQWNVECREELIAKLRMTIRNYLQYKKSCKMAGNTASIMWNINEFWIIYSTLKVKCKVGDFYLLNIISETVNENGKTVYEITESIPDPVSFWKVNFSLKFDIEIDKEVYDVEELGSKEVDTDSIEI